MNDEHFNKLYNFGKEWINNNSKISANNISDFTINLMKFIQTIVKNKNKGEYKKELVLKVLKKFINEIEWGNNNQKSNIDFLFEFIIPNLIDNIIYIAKGNIDLGKMKNIGCCFK